MRENPRNQIVRKDIIKWFVKCFTRIGKCAMSHWTRVRPLIPRDTTDLGGKLLLIFFGLRILKILYWTSTKILSPNFENIEVLLLLRSA